MNHRLMYVLPVLCLGFLPVSFADALRITDVRVDGTNISLSWTHVTNRYIVAHSPSLSTGRFEFVGNVLSTPHSVLSGTTDARFYRIRQVEVVSFPDPLFGAAVRNAIPRKYSPTNEMYDIDFIKLRELRAEYQGITNAAGIERLTDLTLLYCRSNSLTSLDLSANTSLIDFVCSYNSLTSLDLSANTGLTWLFCDHNSLTNLDLSANTSLAWLFCDYNRLTNLDLPANTSLTWVNCKSNSLSNLNLSANPALTLLDCPNNLLTNLDLSANTNLTHVDCRYNPIVEIIVADTNKPPAEFHYSGNPVIREP